MKWTFCNSLSTYPTYSLMVIIGKAGVNNMLSLLHYLKLAAIAAGLSTSMLPLKKQSFPGAHCFVAGGIFLSASNLGR